MKVCLCTGWGNEKDGIAAYSRELARELEKRCGVEIAECGYYIGSKKHYRDLAARANGCDLCHVQFNYVYFNGDLPYRNMFGYFLRQVKVPVIATLHEVRPEFQPAGEAMESGLKRWVFNHTLFVWNILGRRYHRRMYASLDRIIVHTGSHAEKARKLAPPDRKIEIIPHGIPDPGPAVGRQAEAKKKLGLEGKNVLCIPGFINARKGYETALEALALLPDDAVLLIAGGPMSANATDTLYFSGLKKRIGDKGLAQRVIITGFLGQADMLTALAASDICLAPSDSSAGSGSLSWCIACAKPVIAADIPEHREINGRVPCLELFTRSDPGDLAMKIRDLSEDPARRLELSGKMREYAGTFSFGAVAGRLERIYAELTGRLAC